MNFFKTVFAISFVGVFVWVLPVNAQESHAHHDHVSSEVAVKNTTEISAATAELNAAMAKMHKDMNLPITGDPDADFIRGMIPHHEAAVAMAQIVLKYGDDPQARYLARAILRAQRGEIAYMRRWLELRQLPERDAINLNR